MTLDVGQAVGLESNALEAGEMHNNKATDFFFENVAEFKYFESSSRNQN